MLYVILSIAVLLALGLLLCFYGNKMFYPLMAVALFLCGVTMGVKLFGSEAKGWIIGLVIGAVFVVLTKVMYKVLLFLAGGLFGFLLGVFICTLIGDAVAPYAIYIDLLLAAIAGVCALKWSELFIVLSTAGSGASAAALAGTFLVTQFSSLSSFDTGGFADTMNSLSAYLEGDFSASYSTPVLIVTAVLFIAGAVFQFARKKRKS